MAEIDVPISGPAALRQQWSGQIRHGLLFAQLDPAPQAGARIDIRLIARWAGVKVPLRGAVEQAQGHLSIIRLDELDAAAREAFVTLGLEEARNVHWKVATAPAPGPLAAPPGPPAGMFPPGFGSQPTAPSLPSIQGVPPGPAPGAPFQSTHPAAPVQRPVSAAVSTSGVLPAAPPPPSPAAPAPSPFAPRPAAAPAPWTTAGPATLGGSPSLGSMPAVPPYAPPPSMGSMPGVPSGYPMPTSGGLRAVPAPGVQTSGAMPAVPPGRSDGPPTGGDIRAISGAAGPGRAGSESLLPAATEQGDLGSMSWRDVLLHFTTRGSTGVLVIHGFREVRWCYLLDGRPLHYRGDQPHPGEFLYDALAQEVGLSQEDWATAMRMQQVTGLPAGEYLVARGRLSREQLDGALTRRAARITKYLLGANFGRFTFHPLEELRTVFRHQPVDVLPLLMDAQRQNLAQLDDEGLIRKAEPLYAMHIRPIESRWNLVPQLPLSEFEMRLCTHVLPAGWPLKELVALREMEEKSLVRFLFALMGLGVIEAVKEEGATSRRNRAERKLYVALKDMKRRNEFEALHAHWSSIPVEIEAGHTSVLQEFGEEAYRDFLDDRIRGLLAEIRRRADECWARLSGTATRKVARLEIVGTDQLRMASDLLDKQGEMAIFKADFPLAKAIYTRVLELEPGGVEGIENVTRAKAALSDPRIDGAADVVGGVGIDALRRQFDTLVDGD